MTDGQECQLPPNFAVSMRTEDGEYLLATVCEEHKRPLEKRLLLMQKENKMVQGKIIFEPIKTVVTDCIIGLNDDFVDLELKRGIASDRKI